MTMLGAHLRSGRATSLLVAILVAVTVFVLALAPRALLRLGTDELHSEFARQVPGRVDLSGQGPVGLETGTDAASKLGRLDDTLTRLPAKLPSPLRNGAGDTAWVIRTGAATGGLPQSPYTVLALRLAIELHWQDRVRFVEGAPPAPWRPGAGDVDPPPIDVAVSTSTADAMGAEVGDVISVAPVPYRITGTYEVLDPGDGFWTHARDLLQPELIRESGSPLTVQASLFVDPDSVVSLSDAFSAGELSAWIPMSAERFGYADLPTLARQVRAVTATPVELPVGGTLGFRSTIDDVLAQTRASVSAVSALIALGASGFVAVLVAAYALAIQAVIRRRRTVLALGTARGAAPRQLRAITVLEAALISVPGSVLAIVAAALVLPERVGFGDWLLPVLVALTPVALAGALTETDAARQGRDDLGSRWGGSRRWVTEVAVLALAAVAVFLLQRRGLVASSAAVGIDPLLSATPVLLAVGVGLLVLRLYPVPLRAIQRRLRNRRAPVASVGSARAVREPAVGLIGALALVTGIAMTVFSAVMISTVDHGLRQSARDQVGADIQVSAHDLPASLVEHLTDLPTIGTAVALVSASGVEFGDEAGPSEVTLVLADTRALHAVRPDIPVLGAKVDGRLPILISSDWADRVDGSDLSVVNSLAREQGVIDSEALPGVTRKWILVDRSAASELGFEGQVPDRLLASYAAGADPATAVRDVTAAVTAEQPEAFADSVTVDDVASRLAQMRSAPVTIGLERSLIVVSVATLLLTMLVVVLASLTAAGARNRVVGVLRVLGMGPAQIRSLVAWEFAPVAAVAVLAGSALGVGLPFLVTSVLDLRGFFGGSTIPQPALEPLWILAAVAAFVIAVIGAIALATAAGRRFAPAGVLKMGEE